MSFKESEGGGHILENLQHSFFNMQKRLEEKAHMINVIDGNAFHVEQAPDGVDRQFTCMFFSDEPFFFYSANNMSVFKQAGCRIAHKCGYAKDIHTVTSLR